MRHGAGPPDSQCLTDALLAELIDGRLTPESLSRVHLHSAECSACHELMVMVARGGMSQHDAEELPVAAVASAPQPEPSPADWTPPAEFDEFRLVRQLGRGAMGVVYLAHDRVLDRQVAVKFIAAHQRSVRALAHFQTEARAIARLQHPNVLTVFRVGEVDGHPYLVSEYLVGTSLNELSLPVPWRRALGLGIGLARGLAAAHRQGVLHRDLKPANALLTAEGEVKLLDFGLAELFEAGAPPEPGARRPAVGTPRYMAPELFRGESATPRSDLYALGLVLYELCVGVLPPERRELAIPPGEQRKRARPEPLEQAPGSPLISDVPGIDPDFATLIERCLQIDPGERLASAEALCAALERLKGTQAPEERSTGNPYRGLAPFEAEHRALFFGRDADIRAVLERLRRQPLVLVVGDSGVGKSSLCRAGILPRVAQGALDEYRDFSLLTLSPGRRPLAALAAALAPVLGQPEPELGARLAQAPEELGPMLRAAYQGRRGLLLFVDQLEELVTLSEPEQAARFSRCLEGLTLPSAGVRVLLTVRGDFLTRVGALLGLGAEVGRALYLLQPLTPGGVRETIVDPARSRGVVFESEALLQTLVDAMAQGAGSLPLLQFTLAELWERRDPVLGCITRSALEAMGGVDGALSRHADGVLARLDRAEQQAARRILGRLITAEGTRGERSEEELTADSAEARAALRALIEGRLVHARTADGRASYEIAHEALIASWGTLRLWLEEDAGQRVIRQRLEEAGAEWERLGRAEDLLWRKRQLDEAQVLETASLGTREQDFLRASQRAMRHQRVRRWLAVLVLAGAVGGIYGVPRLQEHRDRARFIDERMTEARGALGRGQELGRRASASREKALGLFNAAASVDSGVRLTPPNLPPDAEKAWAQALDELKQASDDFARAEQSLDAALERAPDHLGTRQLLIELTYERILLAESFYRMEERAWLVQRFERMTAGDPVWRERLKAPATLELVTVPPGASVELMSYVDGKPAPVPEHGLRGSTPIAQAALPAGSYHLRFTREGRAPVELPLLLERGRHARIELVLPSSVPEGYVYIPPGCFLSGSADSEELRKFLQSPPVHQSCLEHGYLIGRTEVTLGDWIAYLDELPEKAPERRILETPGFNGDTAVSLRQLPDRTWSFSLHVGGEGALTARAGEPLRYPGRSHRQAQDWRRFPLVGVSPEDITGYLAWLDSSGRLPGARLCSEPEWTRAARGADYRRFPHGNQLHREEANIDETYGRRAHAFGPDEVGAHPASASPFGIHDMAGNAFEITRPLSSSPSDIVLRSGAWYYGDVGALIANRQAGAFTLRDARIGVRVCASFTAR